ncbi:methyltransferase [Halobacteriovorax sp. JY17]|uniref:methyltransferase n=1 Tax=Halobacteriovorax sp. JY17 TaxID=2014617 RepID=UPI000C56F5D1|nr:methyltransferase [Halobacteriovorax sp. JY17]PIK13600.1 MAG: hypothetical protein CES88_15530 [Halobacteriovorax sp. JY17]
MTIELQSKLKKLATFLKQYEFLHRKEFIRKYPTSYPEEITPWIDELMNWSFKDIARLESFPHEDLVEDVNFKIFLKSIRSLSKVDTFSGKKTSMPQVLKKKLRPKKIHEIEKLKSVCDKVKDIESIIDIGGGVGNLSCSLIIDSEKKALCVDMDEKLLDLGRGKREFWPLESKESLRFIHKKFDEKTSLDVNFSKDKALLIGLHSCGDLSTNVLKFGLRNNIRNIINIGCCYHKIINFQNVSKYCQANGIHFTNNALHLASRCGAIVEEETIQKRHHQKRFRYTLHYILHSHGEKKFSSIGNAIPRDYQGSFYDYCRKFDHEEILKDLGRDEVEDFFSKSYEKVWRHYLADTIRLLLGRLIEVYVILDRAQYLLENGLSIQIEEIFDRSLSPRNIMLRAAPL